MEQKYLNILKELEIVQAEKNKLLSNFESNMHYNDLNIARNQLINTSGREQRLKMQLFEISEEIKRASENVLNQNSTESMNHTFDLKSTANPTDAHKKKSFFERFVFQLGILRFCNNNLITQSRLKSIKDYTQKIN